MITLWLTLALLAIFFYGVSMVAQKVALNDMPAAEMIFLSLIFWVPLYLICLVPFVLDGSVWSVTPLILVYALLATSFGQIGYYTYVEAAERGPISIVGSVTAAYPIMVIGFAILILGERKEVTLLQLAGALVITASIIALSFLHGGEHKKLPIGRRYYLLCLVTVFLWGLWAIFSKLTLDSMDPFLFIGIYALVIPPVTLGYYRFKNIRARDAVPKWSRPLKIAVASSVVGNIAFFAEIVAISRGPASIVFPLVASSPLVVVLLAYGFLKERLTRREWMLIAAVIAGIVGVDSIDQKEDVWL
jgi:drug/metabolite transporter, DME family